MQAQTCSNKLTLHIVQNRLIFLDSQHHIWTARGRYEIPNLHFDCEFLFLLEPRGKWSAMIVLFRSDIYKNKTFNSQLCTAVSWNTVIISLTNLKSHPCKCLHTMSLWSKEGSALLFGWGYLKNQPCCMLSKEMVAPVKHILTLTDGLVFV